MKVLWAEEIHRYGYQWQIISSLAFFPHGYQSPDYQCSTSMDSCSSCTIFRIKPVSSFWEEAGCGYIDYCPGGCNAVYTLLQALWTEETDGCQMATRSGLGQVMWWRCRWSSLNRDSHGQSQHRPARDQKSLLRGKTLGADIFRICWYFIWYPYHYRAWLLSLSCECPRANLCLSAVPGPFKARRLWKHPYGIQCVWGGLDGHNWTNKYQLIEDHEQRRKKHMLYLLLRPIIRVSTSDTGRIFWHILAQNFKLCKLAQSSLSSYQLPLFHLFTECISS